MEVSIMKVVLGAILVALIHVLNVLVLKPRSLRAKLERHGIHGPSPHFYFGNIPEMKALSLQQKNSQAKGKDKDKDKDKDDVSASISHTWHSTLFPYMQKWRNQFGPMYMFSSGNIQWLMVEDTEMVKEIFMNTSLNLGKPSFMSEDNRPLLGRGITTSNGLIWAHHRKIIAPELYLDKAKTMANLIVDSTNIMVKSWEARLEKDGGVSEFKIDEDVQSLSADIIARACFGSNYTEGKEIFTKLKELSEVLSKIHVGIPGYRYLPNKSNREMWRLEKEINSEILELMKRRQVEGREEDLLQRILEGRAKNCEGGGVDGLLSNLISRDQFMIDNCKNIFYAGHETTSITLRWCLMLLATHQDWQDRVRAEVLQVCGNDNPDASIVKSMKTLTMVIQETLRLYPPSYALVRAAIQDINIKGILIPKGMNIQIPYSILHQDPELWGPDAHKFNPERFANGVLGACKVPQVYMPFGVGPRICVGQNFAMVELKVILSLILLKFRFSISPTYCHSPTCRMFIEPCHGVVLKMSRI